LESNKLLEEAEEGLSIIRAWKEKFLVWIFEQETRQTWLVSGLE
jgi:hypothetical protein